MLCYTQKVSPLNKTEEHKNTCTFIDRGSRYIYLEWIEVIVIYTINEPRVFKWNMTASFSEIPSRVLWLVLQTRVRILEGQIALACTFYWSKGWWFLHYANSLRFAEYRRHTAIYDGDHLVRLCTHNCGTPIPSSITWTKWTPCSHSMWSCSACCNLQKFPWHYKFTFGSLRNALSVQRMVRILCSPLTFSGTNGMYGSAFSVWMPGG